MAASIQTLENNRAKFAFKKIKSVKDELNEKQRKEFKSWAKKIAVMIKMNGLGQTMAFLRSKTKENGQKDRHYEFYYRLTEEWLKKKKMLSEGKELIESIIEINSVEYRRYTREALALFNWVRRFADGYL